MNAKMLLLLGGSFNPSRLFLTGNDGLVQDTSDFTSLFTESNGAVQVTAAEQVVWVVLDEHLGRPLGASLLTGDSSTFTGGVGNWVGLNGNVAVTAPSGKLRITQTGALGTVAVASVAVTTVAGSWYRVDMTRVTGGTHNANLGAGTAAGNNSLASTVIGTVTGPATLFFRAAGTATTINYYGTTTWATNEFAEMDDITVREVPGNHAVQATAASRPTFKAGNVINYASGTKSLVATFASALGSSCTVARAVAGVGASILTGQTIGTTYTDTTDHCGLVIINRDLTATETQKLTRYLNRKAGV